MQRWAIPGGSILVLIALLFWREWTHSGRLADREAESKEQQASLFALSAELEEDRKALAATEEVLETLQTDHASLRDRATNLEAQRNHLRAETDRQSERARKAEEDILDLRTKLEEARQEALELSVEPRELRTELAQHRARIEELENELDRQGGQRSVFPEALNIEGLASDGSVFALSGILPDSASLPLRVFLCQKDSIRLKGWINRMEDGLAIGHVEQWRVPASTLVKGQKVFILPRQRYEAEN